jgi:Protein of unknown function (DUF5818)
MKRNVWLATVALVISLTPIARAQNSAQEHTKSQKSKQLIAWTQDQKAVPVQDTTAQQDEMQKQPAAQSFTGMIVRSGNMYVLQTADNVTYQLDDQERAKEYEGKQVQVTGSLDKSANMIKVRDIKQTA